MGQPFTAATPFRAALAELAEALAGTLALPQPLVDENFVEGTLQVGEVVFDVYFEHDLCYFSLSAQEKCPLDRAIAGLGPILAFP